METHLHNGFDTPKIESRDLLGFEIGFGSKTLVSGDYYGITEDVVAGTTVAFGDLLYLAVADSRYELADASAISTSGDVRLGICLEPGVDGSKIKILLYGKISSTVFPTFTISTPVYVSETSGDLTLTAPTTTDSVSRRVGFGITSTELFFNPSNDYITHG